MFGREVSWKKENGSYLMPDWFIKVAYVHVVIQAIVTVIKCFIQVLKCSYRSLKAPLFIEQLLIFLFPPKFPSMTCTQNANKPTNYKHHTRVPSCSSSFTASSTGALFTLARGETLFIGKFGALHY